MKITGEIFQVGGTGYTAPEDGSVYLIHLGEMAALIDAGCGRSEEQLLENIQKLGVDIKNIAYLLITHCHYDHAGGAASLKKKLGCPIVAHRLDAHFLESGDDQVTAAAWYGATMAPVSVDRKITGPEEEIILADRVIRAIHIPGHSPGSMAYYMKSEGRRVLFAQDVHGPLHPDLLSDSDDYRTSLHHLLALEADVLCEGHFGVYEGTAVVREFIQSYVI